MASLSRTFRKTPQRGWVFATPWIPGRHPKRRDYRTDGARGFFEATLAADLAVHGMPASSVTLTNWCQVGTRRMATTEFRTGRTNKARRRSFGAVVELGTEHGGPILLGAGAHFGLGRLVCVDRPVDPHDRPVAVQHPS